MLLLSTLLCIQANLSADLDAILNDSKLSGALVCAAVTAPDGTRLYERNPSVRAVPGSNQKLLSVAFALDTLGEEFVPETRIWKRPDGLHIETTGDPSLTYKKLTEARAKLGIDRRVPVILNQPYAPGIPPSWEFDDLPNKYAAPVEAFTVDRGSFELWAVKGKALLLPANYGVKVVRVAGGPLDIRYDPGKAKVVVAGALPADTVRLDTLALPNPAECAAQAIGGSSLSYTSARMSGEPTMTIQGDSMEMLVHEALTKSDNQYAEHLLLLAATAMGSLPSRKEYETACDRLQTFMAAKVGAVAGDVRPYDGSGMSRHNWVTADAASKLIAWSQEQPWYALYQSGMATPGNGTLKSRLAGSSFVGKTGTLEGVSALSGTVSAATGGKVIISLIFNHFLATSSEVRAIQDKFVRKIEDAVSNGTLLDGLDQRADHISFSFDSPIDGDRFLRPGHDRDPARAGFGRRAQSRHEGIDRAKRMAVRRS